jgi:hypothetical protein
MALLVLLLAAAVAWAFWHRAGERIERERRIAVEESLAAALRDLAEERRARAAQALRLFVRATAIGPIRVGQMVSVVPPADRPN